MAKQWTFADEKFIRDNHAKMTPQELADALNKTLGAMNMKLSRMKLTNHKRSQKEIEHDEYMEALSRSLDTARNNHKAVPFAWKVFNEGRRKQVI